MFELLCFIMGFLLCSLIVRKCITFGQERFLLNYSYLSANLRYETYAVRGHN